MTIDAVEFCRSLAGRVVRSIEKLAFAVLVVGLSGPAWAQGVATDKVVVRVNGVEIRESDVALAEQDIGQGLPANDPQKKRDYLINYLSDMTLLVQEAEKKKLDGDADLNRRIVFEQNKVVMEAILARRGKAAITEPALRDAYKEALSRAAKEIEYRIRDIQFVANPADKNAGAIAERKANAAMKRVQAGEDFAALANEMNESPTGKKNGGDLGYLAKQQMSDVIHAAVSGLEQGKVSGPIKSETGWHIIKLEDKRARQIPAFEVSEVRGELEAYVYRKAQHEFIEKLRSEAKIERIEK